MNTAISGSRTFTDRRFVERVVERLLERGDHIIIGDAPSGVDFFAFERLSWADKTRWTRYVAHWTLFGKGAGHERNGRMLDHPAELLVAIYAPGPYTPGTSDCIVQAIDREIPVHVYREGFWLLKEVDAVALATYPDDIGAK